MPTRFRRAFTLIELIVVVFIVALMLALVFAAIRPAEPRTPARRTQCKNNLKQLGLAIHIYHDGHNTLPPSRVSNVC